MSQRFVMVVAMALAATVAAAIPANAQSAEAETVMRTPDGQPDISGIFTFRTLTPLQRPAALEGQDRLGAEEAAQFEASERIRLNRDLFDPETGAPNAGYQSRAEGGVLSYNEFWYERGIELTADKRTSLVVDPPNGRIPFKPEYQEAAQIRRLNLRNGFADHYTDRSLADRCIMGFNAGPPMVSSAYNNNVQIFQAPGYVVILNEMVHNARIIPIDGRPHGELPQWSGDSRGRWEGETLVVETKNFLRETSLGGSSADTSLVERFRRMDPDTVMYEFTVEDPNNFIRPWTAMMPLRRTDGPLFEYACHEGNIGMAGIMAGARRKDTQAVTSVR
ncbi:MAG: hypothetical protein F4018_06305 [Acidobacteria bacterium]|nr:hypothetical protein [Acidobacteriota bacterium]MYH29147.1 hypothetical protein [Acidobacteriota bacterium]MYK87974.1 hypothetical protein [Acidobacteriota bacterium]